MKKIIKIAIIIIISLVVLTSIGLNLYYFGYKKLETNLMQKGFNMAVSQIIQSIKMVKEVRISDDIILIQKEGNKLIGE